MIVLLSGFWMGVGVCMVLFMTLGPPPLRFAAQACMLAGAMLLFLAFLMWRFN